MTKALYAIALAILSVTLVLLWISGPAQAEEEPSEPPSPTGTVRMAARDAFACPGMHAEWLDEKTVQCLKVSP
ncbi:hypothetical protein [Comamonas suwonensis]|uniref:hypothetical protein n=1 Tax=Comamonas suwonensis TaxID=2606214 RepID=UPI00145F3A82|nr:hypothetical protein [Comamonas suwonensis]MBI1625209.1 hypothetical protein [Comamonas suwonensis]